VLVFGWLSHFQNATFKKVIFYKYNIFINVVFSKCNFFIFCVFETQYKPYYFIIIVFAAVLFHKKIIKFSVIIAKILVKNWVKAWKCRLHESYGYISRSIMWQVDIFVWNSVIGSPWLVMRNVLWSHGVVYGDMHIKAHFVWEKTHTFL